MYVPGYAVRTAPGEKPAFAKPPLPQSFPKPCSTGGKSRSYLPTGKAARFSLAAVIWAVFTAKITPSAEHPRGRYWTALLCGIRDDPETSEAHGDKQVIRVTAVQLISAGTTGLYQVALEFGLWVGVMSPSTSSSGDSG